MTKKTLIKKERLIASGLAIILIAVMIIPRFVNAMMIYQMWDHPLVARTWTNEPDEWLARQTLDKYILYKKTGMALNTNFYFSAATAGYHWPLGGKMYLEERPGMTIPGTKILIYAIPIVPVTIPAHLLLRLVPGLTCREHIGMMTVFLICSPKQNEAI